MKMQGRRGFTLAYKSMTQDIAECNTVIDRFLSEYAVVLSFTNDASRFLTMPIVSVLPPSIHRETVQTNATVSTSLRDTHRCCGS
jgi:hypothetical protein